MVFLTVESGYVQAIILQLIASGIVEINLSNCGHVGSERGIYVRITLPLEPLYMGEHKYNLAKRIKWSSLPFHVFVSVVELAMFGLWKKCLIFNNGIWRQPS